jgi:hypothetical protein
MIVRKYCERKRWGEGIAAKEQNKRDLIKEFRSELEEWDWYRCGTKDREKFKRAHP